ncbi:MAG: isochorismatase family protein [Candidatus Altiarchaeota archaeon]|nr:isochorismatase family protein [Candidatus Altiarchaeota archaeon]
MTLKREQSMLLVVDVQDKLIDSIHEKDRVIANIRALIEAACTMGLSVQVTEQEKLGSTVAGIKEVLERNSLYNPVVKEYFSCYRDDDFRETLKEESPSNIILCGIEAHICVMQSALDLIANKYQVYLVEDAVSSHSGGDCETAVKRLINAGAVVASTEMLIYELLKKAGTDEFRGILPIVKGRRNALTP